MKIVRPFTVTDAAVISTDVLENDYAVWNSGTTYGATQRCISTVSHRIYESVAGSNINNNPLTDTTGKWLDVGPTNRWAMFDGTISSKTAKATSFTYTIRLTGRADTLALLNLTAASVSVQVIDDVYGTVYDRTFNMVSSAGINNFWAYYFEPIKVGSTLVIEDLPNYLSPRIIITVNHPGDTASVGAFILGMSKYIGATQYGSSVGIKDFSKKDTNAFGDIILVERPYSKKGSFNIKVPNSILDEVTETLASYRTTPILYIGSECFDSTTIFGFYRDFTLGIGNFSETDCNIEVEGLT